MIDQIARELAAASKHDPYSGFEQAYVYLVKLSLDEPEPEEFARVRAFVNRLPEASISQILQVPELDELLGLTPPLETVLSHEREELRSIETAEAIAAVRTRRSSNPRKALRSLLFILKNIRNKRDHGFKSPEGLRDQEILADAQAITLAIAERCLAFQGQLRRAR